MPYVINTLSERYSVTDTGMIGRPQLTPPLQPSEQWQAVALVRLNNSGNVVERIAFADWRAWLASQPAFTRKNGKGIWRLIDLDHGTRRQWGSPVLRVYWHE